MRTHWPLTGRTGRWMAAALILAVAAAVNLWIHSLLGARTPFLPFYPAIIAIGFACGIVPGLIAMLFAECFVAFLWRVTQLAPASAGAESATLLLFALGSGLGLAVAVYARRLLLESRRTRERMDTALRTASDAEHRFEVALKGGAIIAWACDAQRRYIWVYNPGAGFRVEDFVGKRIFEMIPRERAPRFAEAVDRVFMTGRGERLPVTLDHGGQTYHYLSNIDPVIDEAGRVIGLVGASTDTSELHRAQEALRDREQQLRTISDALPVLIAYIDQIHHYRFNNAAYERWRERSRDEITGHHVRDVIGEAAYESIRPSLERALAGQSEHLETRLHYPDIGERDVAVTYIPHIERGAVAGVIALVEDISVRTRNEAAMRAQERRWRAMFDAQPECVSLVARDGSLLDMNPAGLALIEAESIEQVRGRSLEHVIAPAHRPVFRAQLDAAFADRPLEQPSEFELVGLRGTRRVMESRAVPLHDESGQVSAALAVTRDVSERKRNELAQQESAQRKDEFLATLAHELRNPMAPIRYAAATLRKGAPESTIQHARGVIERQAAQMSRLLDDLLDMSRVTRNVIELKRSRLDLRDLVAEATEMAKPVLTNLQHRLTVSIPPNALWVHGDGTRLLQVIGNLIDNAAKYTEPGGSIELRLESEGGSAVMHVKDTGIGLAPEMIPKVFDLFSQVHKSLDATRGGLGIGLTVVRRLVELHGGTIEVASDGLRQGATFSVRLPLEATAHEPDSESAAPQKIVPMFMCRPHILVVDDNRDAAETLAEMMRIEGFPVAVALDGASALAAFEQIKPAIVLLDMGLPDVNGTEVARQIRRLPAGRTAQIIAVTGWGQAEDRQRTQQAGVDLHLVKPVDPGDLLRLLDQRLGQSPRTQAASGDDVAAPGR
jgi:PAS domain S-box-containing protein